MRISSIRPSVVDARLSIENQKVLDYERKQNKGSVQTQQRSGEWDFNPFNFVSKIIEEVGKGKRNKRDNEAHVNINKHNNNTHLETTRHTNFTHERMQGTKLRYQSEMAIFRNKTFKVLGAIGGATFLFHSCGDNLAPSLNRAVDKIFKTQPTAPQIEGAIKQVHPPKLGEGKPPSVKAPEAIAPEVVAPKVEAPAPKPEREPARNPKVGRIVETYKLHPQG